VIDLVPLGDRGFLARFADERAARAWAASARRALDGAPGVEDVVLAYASVGVIAGEGVADLDGLEARLRALGPIEAAGSGGVTFDVPVLYDGEDLPEVASRLGLGEAEVIAHHAGAAFDVFAVGFLPGFPYAGYLPGALSGLPRRDSPRTRVPAGSVAIAGRQTGIYPAESPGGWHLIGRTPLVVADLDSGHFPIRAGDRLRFRAIDAGEFRARAGDRPARPP
jgi:KipI family sensor histidine kinase inhibitor